MSTYCQEFKDKITYGEPFFILAKENMSGGAIVSLAAMNRIPAEERITQKLAHKAGVNVYAASSSYSHNESYSWFDIQKEAFLYALHEEVFARFFPNCKEMFGEG
jgi:hypothetical protein